MNALEKLGWTKTKIDTFNIQYERFHQKLIVNTSWEIVSVENISGLSYIDILALAEIIKSLKENGK